VWLNGIRLRQFREARGLSPADLAKKALQGYVRVGWGSSEKSHQREEFVRWLTVLESRVSDQPDDLVQWLAETLNVPPVALSKDLGEPRDYSLLGGYLKFSGWRVGMNEWQASRSRPGRPDSITVAIYVTRRSRRIVTAYWSREGRRLHDHKAAMHLNCSMALLWLRDRGKGHLGRASKAAWKAAHIAEPGLISYLP